MKPLTRHCAVYTRKSTDEGLEQDFNSLDAQREACQAYILSQKTEGWQAVKTTYDDGGYSGGNMERPALKKLMEDIQAGKVHIIVVYKIDRLTRSLMDFAKLVEVFDKHGVTFVSVTQSFNTTTSMGRLTLNVLLSFAQFEREVTGERIRDKVAASRKKGMWMGGGVPFGYKVQNRALVVHERDATIVQKILQAYLQLKSLLRLKIHVEKEGYRTRRGCVFNRASLYSLLTNPVYIGKARHKTQVYDGLHPAIVSQDLWDAVQKQLVVNPDKGGHKRVSQEFLLQGLLFDEAGILYTPVFTSKDRRLYRYYVSRDKFEGREDSDAPSRRLPAQEIETFLEKTLRSHIEDTRKLSEILSIDHDLNYPALQKFAMRSAPMPIDKIVRKSVCKVILREAAMTIEIKPENLLSLLQQDNAYHVKVDAAQEVYSLTAPFEINRALKSTLVIRPPATNTPEDIFSLPPHKLKNLVQGIVWRDEHFNGMSIAAIARREECDNTFVGRLIRESLEIA